MKRVANLAVAACATGACIAMGATVRDAARRVVRAIDDNIFYIFDDGILRCRLYLLRVFVNELD